MCVSIFSWALNSVSWFACLFLCQYHSVLIITVLEYNLTSVSVIPVALFFCFNIALDIWDILWFHINFRIIYFSYVKIALEF